MRFNLITSKILALSLIAVCTYQCKGAGTNPDGSAGSTGSANPAATGSFLGQWTGKYANKDNSASLNETPARATFTGNEAKSGTFRIELTQITNAFIGGNFTIIDQTSLMLDIKQSTISTIGLAGTQALINYRLIGNTLELTNDQVKLNFAPDLHASSNDATAQPNNQQATPNSGSGQEDGQTGGKPDPIVGRWFCTDKANNQWQMNLRNDSMFYIEITNTSSGNGGIWLAGSVNISHTQGKPDATLKVTTSAIEKYTGMDLEIFLRSDTDMNMIRVATGEEIPCTRI